MLPETIKAIDRAIAKHGDEQSPTYMLHLAHVAVGRAGDTEARKEQRFYTLRAIAYLVRSLELDAAEAPRSDPGST